MDIELKINKNELKTNKNATSFFIGNIILKN